ncbi:4-amino-4-deoxychorismate lyase [Methylohalomonas lacus]|uniref:Aminodeoxychorismate lyase n=1 Tax=Methylohalomonas lacus TaxID=398773 RepID=A0AAE3L542_9GAMM|nr:aminodeoxychorismate lyase [Methylohalomonas lacus]MCS3902637.1 4-amino-4-deoxychorismate lyase [Methylohalomonas lacus]
MNLPALINGQPADSIAITDRGLQYGDGLFETIAVVDGRLLCWPEHMARLEEGCRRLSLLLPDTQQLHDEAQQVASDAGRAVLKLTLTRGSAGRGYAPAPAAIPNRIISLHPWPEYPQQYHTEGVRVRLCTNRLASNPLLAGIKHLNRLEQVLARGEWSEPDVAEGLMLDGDGNVIEGTMSNLFVVRHGILETPDVVNAGIAGIIRGRVLAAAHDLDIDAMIATLDLHDIEAAEELFLCNSLIGIWPVRAVGDKTFAPGALTRRLRDYLVRQDWISPD